MSTTEFRATGAGPGDDRPDRWPCVLAATPTTTVRPCATPGRRWWIDDLGLVDCACGPCPDMRERLHPTDTDGQLVVVGITSGTETDDHAGAEVHLRAVREPPFQRSLLIPRAALDEVGGRAWVDVGLALDGAAPATRLLNRYLDTVSEVLPQLGPSAVAAARNATLELVLGAVRGDANVPTVEAVGPALRAAMDRFIERHLLDDSVGPTTIAGAHGVSVRTVNRVFHATGQTVGEVVRMRRLARAREELTASDDPISTIANRWGFCDGSHFSRNFKAHYGSSPRDYRAAARAATRATGAQVQRSVATVQDRRWP